MTGCVTMMFQIELNSDNSFKALGLFLRVHRLRAGLSLRDLGFITSISHTLIANIEQGKVSGSHDTLKDLFTSLKVPYYDSSDIEEEFKQSYDKTFDFLYKYDYTRATIEMEKLLEKEEIYRHSSLITDYALIKFFYLVLLGKEAKDQYISIHVLKKVVKNFNARQKQLFYLIEGIDYYNQGFYTESEEKLDLALKIGVSNLDYLTRVFLVKCYVKMYRFMDVISVGNHTIDFFEAQIVYLRAMEVRLSIAYSYMLVRKFQDSEKLLDSVSQFSNNFNAKYLIEESNLLLAALYIYTNRTVEARKLLSKIDKKETIVYFLRTRVALRENKLEEVKKIFEEYKNEDKIIKTRQHQIVMDITMKEAGVLDITEEEFVTEIRELIDYGVRATDIEVIDSSFNYLIRYYKKKRMYKKALDASEKARDYRRYGFLKRN